MCLHDTAADLSRVYSLLRVVTWVQRKLSCQRWRVSLSFLENGFAIL